jgi:hypothetical protein
MSARLLEVHGKLTLRQGGRVDRQKGLSLGSMLWQDRAQHEVRYD